MSAIIHAMIPARIGSTRLKMKNLALVGGEPLIGHAIKAAKASGAFERIVLNSDHEVFARVAERYGVEFYCRPAALGTSQTKSDDVVADFMEKHPGDAIAWVNPTSPLQTGDEIRDVVACFRREKLDTLFTVEDKQVHCLHGDRPINFNPAGKFAQTQDLVPVRCFVYSVMMWRCETFLSAMKARGCAFFSGRVGYFPVSRASGVIVKRAEDLNLVDSMLRARETSDDEITYDDLVRSLEG